LIADRNLDWPGCFNARDLGGLRTTEGRETRRRAVVRSDNLDHLTGEGWAELRAYGVRTVIDLRNDDERPTHPEPRASGLTTVHVPLDDLDDTRFWADWANGPQFATPLYYRPFLERKPERAAAAVAAVARARPGASSSTAAVAETGRVSSPCCCWRWSGWRQSTSLPTTS
jgi:protein-tyrosine phosphatase